MKKNIPKLKIVVCGYYGFGNLGDELILSQLCHTLRNKHGDNIQISVLSNSPKETTKTHDVKSINRTNYFAILFSIMCSNVFLLGGGGLIQDKTSNLSLYYYLVLSFIAKIIGKKVVIFGIGVNPLKLFNRSMCAMVLNMTNAIMVRDSFSYGYLVKIGVHEKKITLGIDPVFSNHIQIQVNQNKIKQGLFILKKGDNNTALALVNFANFVAKTNNSNIVLGYFQKNDFEFCNSVNEMLANTSKRSDIVEFTFENINLLNNYAFILTQRYHGAVMAINAGIPFIVLSDDEKLVEIAKEYSQIALNPNTVDCSNNFEYAFKELWQNYTIYSQKIRHEEAKIALKVKENTEFLYRCVNLI